MCLLWFEVSWYTSWLVDWRVLMLFFRVKWGCLVVWSACARCSLFVAGARGAFVQFQVAMCERHSGIVCFLWFEVSWCTSWLVDWRVLMLFFRVKWGCSVLWSACARCLLFVAGARYVCAVSGRTV